MITSENYHIDTTHISKSGLDKINISPAHYYHYYLNPNKSIIDDNQTPEQFLGEVFHTALLEPQFFNQRYLVLNQKIDRRTREGKETWFKYMKAAKGKRLVKKEVYEKVCWMVKSVNRQPIARKLFTSGKAEQIFTATDPIYKIKCKIKTDWVTDGNIIVDLKSAMDASCILDDDESTSNVFTGFPKAIFNHRYDVQNAFYFDVFKWANQKTANGFIFVAVEKEPPFEVGLFYLSASDIENARHKYMENLRTLKSCRQSGIWKGYPEKIIRVQTST